MIKTAFLSCIMIFTLCVVLPADEDFLSGLEIEQGQSQLRNLNSKPEEADKQRFQELSKTPLGLKAGILTSMFMEGKSDPEIQQYCRKVGLEILSQGQLPELSELYACAPPNVRDAMEPLLDEIKQIIAEKDDEKPGSRSLFEFSDLWALPVFNSRFPGYGERKIWLNYKKGRKTRTEIGATDIEERTQTYLKKANEKLLVPADKSAAFLRVFPDARQTGTQKVRIPGGEKTVVGYQTSIAAGCTIVTNKVTETEYSWYRLLATPVGNSPLSPIYVKVGEFYIPRTLPGAEAFVTSFSCP
jgi:hypothetical protein